VQSEPCTANAPSTAPHTAPTQEASARAEEVVKQLLQVSQRHCEEWAKEDVVPTPPTAVVLCSAHSGGRLRAHGSHVLVCVLLVPCSAHSGGRLR